MNHCLPIFLLFCFFHISAHAADINLELHQDSRGRDVKVTLHNRSSIDVRIDRVSAQLHNDAQVSKAYSVILGSEKREYSMKLAELPTIPGSYPMIVRVYYYNEGMLFSLLNVGTFNVGVPFLLPAKVSIRDTSIVNEGEIVLHAEEPEEWELYLPDEITVLSDTVNEGVRIYKVRGQNTGFNNRYDIYAISQKEVSGRHSMAFARASLGIDYRQGYARGRVPDTVLLVMIGAAFMIAAYVVSLRPATARFATALGKYAVRLFFLSSTYYLLRHGADIFSYLALVVKIEWMQTFIFDPFHSHILSKDYRYFFKYFIDYYFGVCVVGCFAYSYFFDSEKGIKYDKYSCFFNYVLTFPWLLYSKFKDKEQGESGRASLRWDYKSRLGFLTLCVKFFYIPLLTNWAINNIFHQIYLTNRIEWTLASVNAYFLALFIFVDTLIFGFGYIFESKFLKNEIRSVEPTIIGWIVCLWCYPPFNSYSFHLFDHDWFTIAVDAPQWLTNISLVGVTLGWGIFAWASLSLGFKASNLTNRGIVCKGPYRFCRHPAYAVKVFIWFLEGVFFARYYSGMIFGLCLIYFLRAWTEERHLSRDPDYLEYKKKVPYMLIPKVF